jgi:gamma-glutamylcyclotransferase (GGCT)/AIG2-like uncharacterized protein YtfP
MPLYFAYGANMDAAAMAVRCPGATALGVARLPRHRFIITRDGYASVLRDPRATVHGVLWDLSLAHIRTLDKFEEIDRGLYAKIIQPVLAGVGAKRALVYVGAASETGGPRPGYLESVIDSAKAWALPPAYIAEMARFLSARRHSGVFEPGAAPATGVRPRAAAPSSTVGGASRAKPIGTASRASDAWSWKP